MQISRNSSLWQGKSERAVDLENEIAFHLMPLFGRLDFDDVPTAFNDWAKHEDNEWMSIDGKAQLQTVRQHIKISFH